MKTLIFVQTAVLSVFCMGAYASQIGDLAASMHAGEWRTLSTQNIATVLGSAEVGGGATGGIMPFAEDCAWDPATERLFYVGGDHNWDVISTKFVSYSAATNSWQTMNRPPWATFNGAMHGYDHNAIDAARGIFYCRKTYSNRIFEKYNISTGAWTELPANNIYGYSYCCCGGVEYYPELKGLLHIQANADGGHTAGVYLFSDSLQAWRGLGTNLPVPDGNTFAEYNPVHHVMVIGGGTVLYKLTGTGQMTKLGQAPLGLGVNRSLFTVDPVGGDYLVFGRDGSFYTFDVTRDVWTRQSGSDFFSPTTNADGGIISQVVATPVSSYGVVMFAKFYRSSSNVYLYKHTGTSVAQTLKTPSAPSGISVRPNPVTTRASISINGLAGGQTAVISIFDLRGRRVGHLTVAKGSGVTWQAEGLSPGLYFVKAETGAGALIEKFLIQ